MLMRLLRQPQDGLGPRRSRSQPSRQLSGLEHTFHREVGAWQQLSQRVCAEAGWEISSLPEEHVKVQEVGDAEESASAASSLTGQIWIKVWAGPPPPPPLLFVFHSHFSRLISTFSIPLFGGFSSEVGVSLALLPDPRRCVQASSSCLLLPS